MTRADSTVEMVVISTAHLVARETGTPLTCLTWYDGMVPECCTRSRSLRPARPSVRVVWTWVRSWPHTGAACSIAEDT